MAVARRPCHAAERPRVPRDQGQCREPGWIETRDWQVFARTETPRQPERDKLQRPVARVGKREDIAEACLFLAEGAGFMTGQNIVIDGGMTVR